MIADPLVKIQMVFELACFENLELELSCGPLEVCQQDFGTKKNEKRGVVNGKNHRGVGKAKHFEECR